MSTLSPVELGVLGPLQVRQFGLPVPIPGAKPRALLTMLGLYGGAVVPGDTLVELLWNEEPPRTALKALQTHISALRRVLGDGFVLTQGAGWALDAVEVDAVRYARAVRRGRAAMAGGDTGEAVACFDEALTLWRGVPELPDGRRGETERIRWTEDHAALVEDRADATLATGRAAELIGELEAAIAEAPLRERRWGQLMLALYRAGRQGEALAAYQRVRSLLADELGVDPGPELRRLEAKIVAQDESLEVAVAQHFPVVTRAVTFLLTDIEGSTAAWETDSAAMAAALARHDEMVEQVVTFAGGRLIKTRGEGDATFSVFDRPSAAAAAAAALQDAVAREDWPTAQPVRIRIALHTGEAEYRDGDYFGRAVNRAARLRSLAAGGQTLCSGATAELVVDSLDEDVALTDLGLRTLKNLIRPEHVFELRRKSGHDTTVDTDDAPLSRPGVPPALAGSGPFVGRGGELDRLSVDWQAMLTQGVRAALIAGEPGVGKTRLAGEWSRTAYELGAVVVYGRCDEDLGAPYQPFAEALRTLVSYLGGQRMQTVRGVESLLPLVPSLAEVLPGIADAPRADPDTERYALFDAVVATVNLASANAPIVMVLDDLHWAARSTLLLLRHLLRFGDHARVQIVGTYRNTDLDRTHPLAAMLVDLHRDGSADRLTLAGLDEGDVTTYVAESGYDDEELARALSSVTGGNPFFLIEALRHVDESGGHWDAGTLPQGVREAVSRRLSRLPEDANTALAAAAVVGSVFGVELVERVVERDLVDAFDEAARAGILIEEPSGRYRFNHALVRQSLLAELPSVRRMRLHQRIAAALEERSRADDEMLAELAYHYFECAWAGNATKAVEYCRRAADQAMARLAYEVAGDLYDKALHALDELDEPRDRDEQQAELLIARCEALLAAGDVESAAGAVAQLRSAAMASDRLQAWGTCFESQLTMLTEPERLDEIEADVAAAAATLAGLGDAAGEAKAYTVRATCLGRLGRVGDCEAALDRALTAARRARDDRRVNAVLAGAPLAALWGPSPVPRAGGRCLDVVRLLRITTGSPVVEAASTRCQGVLDALRGRTAAARALVASARRTLDELGMRHAVLEVEQFAGIVELIAGDAVAAQRHLRKAYLGFRRMRLDVDTAETAALLARACLTLGEQEEADGLCKESERLAGHALKASIAWRTVRAQLLARNGELDSARRVAEEAVALAERTDALVDHGDACLALAAVLDAAGDGAGARSAAQRAVNLYELKGAAALVDQGRLMLGQQNDYDARTAIEPTVGEPDNACARTGRRLVEAVARRSWSDVEALIAPEVEVESRRAIVGHPPVHLTCEGWRREMIRYHELGLTHWSGSCVAARGERLALVKLTMGGNEDDPGAPQDEALQVVGLDQQGRIALEVWFDVDDADAALAELDSRQALLEAERRRPLLENAATRTGDSGVTAHTPVAVRGDRLILSRIRSAERGRGAGANFADSLEITEVDVQGEVVARVVHDVNDLDAAIAELDARYLAGEAAPHADSWSWVMDAFAALNRHEFPDTTSDFVMVDHQMQYTTTSARGLVEYLEASWGLTPKLHMYVEAVHRLSDRGAVITAVVQGASRDGFSVSWRFVEAVTRAGDLCDRCEVFDENDLEAALAGFDHLSPPTRSMENEATRRYQRFNACLVTGDREGLAATMTDDFVAVDGRRVVGTGQVGRDAAIDHVRVLADLGVTQATSTILATRGSRLALMRAHFGGRDVRPDAFSIDVLHLAEVGEDSRMSGFAAFDVDDLDAAIAELDARYLAGEAAPFSHTWSLIADAYAAFNRREIAPTSPGWASIDHRRGAAFAEGEMTAYLSAAWADSPETRICVEAVHRLTDTGAVVTHAAKGKAITGFEAEWRDINVLTLEGDLINRSELFDADELDAAIGRFDELNPLRSPLRSGMSRFAERFRHCFSGRDWQAIAAMLVDAFTLDDRRRTVNGGIRHGRDAEISALQAAADVGFDDLAWFEIATRGGHLALLRVEWFDSRQPDGNFRAEWLGVTEINADERLAAFVMFDLSDFDAAVAELDARYRAGEAETHSRTYSVVADAFSALSRQELPPTTVDFIDVDHRRVAAPSGGLKAYLNAAFEDMSETSIYIERVHRLSELGAVVTHVVKGVSTEGLDLEWRITDLLTVEIDRLSRCEVFDEPELDAALARFDELSSPAMRLENSAIRTYERWLAMYRRRDWIALGESMAADILHVDRRRTVNGGFQRGREAVLDNMRAIAAVGVTNIEPRVLATRGDHLALVCQRVSGGNGPDALGSDVMNVVEVDAGGLFTRGVAFDPDDFAAALAELDARYMAGEGAPHAHIWSLITDTYAAFNRHELSTTTPDWVNIDHRLGIGSAPGDMNSYVTAAWDLVPDISTRIESVHRLSSLGAVFTHTERGTSHDGFDAEWREVALLTFEGDAIDRCELFDERDLAQALAHFDELDVRVTAQNLASRTIERFVECFSSGDWDAVTDILHSGFMLDDRRRVVGAGVRQGRDAELEDLRAFTEVGLTDITFTVLAVRGERLVLSRTSLRENEVTANQVHTDTLAIAEVDAQGHMTATVMFDVDDLDAAYAELDARYAAELHGN